jgi:hypothetical protein
MMSKTWGALLAFTAVALSFPSRAGAAPSRDVVNEPEKVAFISGIIGKAKPIDLGEGGRFTLLSIERAEPTTPWEVDGSFEAAAFVPNVCHKYYTTIVTTTPTADLVGKRVEAMVFVEEPRGEPSPWCRILAGHGQILRDAVPVDHWRWNELAKKNRDAVLPGITAARKFFRELAAQEDERPTPVDAAVGEALEQLDSKAALDVALDLRMYRVVRSNFHWRHDPTMHGSIERELIERPWGARLPDSDLVSVFWSLSPKEAAETLRGLAEKDPAKVTDILTMSPARADALDLWVELYRAKKLTRIHPPHGLYVVGGRDELLEQLQTEAPDYERKSIGEAHALSKQRAQLGVTDGWALARYMTTHKGSYEADDPFRGMQITLTGKHRICCDVTVPMGDGWTLQVDVDCDAVSFRAACEGPDDEVVTVSGMVEDAHASSYRVEVAGVTDHVDIKLAHAKWERGGDIPEATKLPEGPHDSTAGKEKATQCGCEVVGAPSSASYAFLLQLALVGAACLRRIGA